MSKGLGSNLQADSFIGTWWRNTYQTSKKFKVLVLLEDVEDSIIYLFILGKEMQFQGVYKDFLTFPACQGKNWQFIIKNLRVWLFGFCIGTGNWEVDFHFHCSFGWRMQGSLVNNSRTFSIQFSVFPLHSINSINNLLFKILPPLTIWLTISSKILPLWYHENNQQSPSKLSHQQSYQQSLSKLYSFPHPG